MHNIATTIRHIIVLIGVKEQCALYPSKHSLLAIVMGITVDMAASVNKIASKSRET